MLQKKCLKKVLLIKERKQVCHFNWTLIFLPEYPNQNVVSEQRARLSKTDYIAIGAGIGGFLLLLTVVILFICLRRKNSEKPFTTTYSECCTMGGRFLQQSS